MNTQRADDNKMRNVSILAHTLQFSVATDYYVKVHMFSNAQNLSIRDTAIHNAGRDITIINNYIYTEPEPVCAHFPYVTSSDDLRGLS